MKSEFESYGVDESVLADLHNRWQLKVINSHVADFEPLPQASAAHALHAPTSSHPLPGPYTAGAGGTKPDPGDGSNPYGALPPGAAMLPYMMPGMPGQPLRGPPPPSARPQYMLQPQQNMLALPRGPSATPAGVRTAAPVGSTERIPQVDGPARSPQGLPSASHPSLPPASHPSLPQVPPAQPAPTRPPPLTTTVGRSEHTSDAINSDLDDSDSEQEDGVDAEGTVKDIVFCTYDKVARVKNKWKCVLKDGMIHVNGKDYLFSKCTGEFEW